MKVKREAKELIEERVRETEARVKKQVETELEAVIEGLITAKDQLLDALASTLARVLSNFTARLDSFQPSADHQSLSPFCAAVSSLDIAQIADCISHDRFVDFAVSKQLKREIRNSLFRIDQVDLSLVEPCAWAGQYVIDLPHRCFINLANFERTNSGIISMLDRKASFIGLPDGRIYVVNNDSRCFLLDCDYAECRFVGSTSFALIAPGLALVDCKVYIFGGAINSLPLDSVEVFNFRSEAIREVAERMKQARAVFMPCVWRGRIYIAGGVPAASIEVFNPETEEFTNTTSWVNDFGHACSFPAATEIIIICRFLFSYSPEKDKVKILDTERNDSRSLFTPQLFQGKYYFGLQEDGTLNSFNPQTFEVSFDCSK